MTRSSIAARTRLAPRLRRFPPLADGFGSLACSIPDGLIDGGPLSPFSRAISARNAVFSALNAEIFAKASVNNCLRSSSVRPSTLGGDPGIPGENHDPYSLGNPPRTTRVNLSRPEFCSRYDQYP
jgi:hypothetical protein